MIPVKFVRCVVPALSLVVVTYLFKSPFVVERILGPWVTIGSVAGFQIAIRPILPLDLQTR